METPEGINELNERSSLYLSRLMPSLTFHRASANKAYNFRRPNRDCESTCTNVLLCLGCFLSKDDEVKRSVLIDRKMVSYSGRAET